MQESSNYIIIEFCKLCSWAHETWLNHKELFERNPIERKVQLSGAADVMSRLSIISQEYSLLQIVKLHDKAIVNGNITLGIDYVIKYFAWDESTRKKLKELEIKLNNFSSKIKSARNKCLSHNDLESILAGENLGEFQEGEDDAYFECLQEFVNIVHEEKVGGLWPFDDLVKNDVEAFLSVLQHRDNA